METGIDAEMSEYSGDLGVLAGDTIRYLGVLDAQRSLYAAYAAQRGLIVFHLVRLVNQVTRYNVLGGGA